MDILTDIINLLFLSLPVVTSYISLRRAIVSHKRKPWGGELWFYTVLALLSFAFAVYSYRAVQA